MLGSILFGLHYLLLGATTASAMCCMGAVQGLALVLLRRRSLQLGAVGATVVIGAILTSLTWSGFPSFLSQVGQLGSAAGRLQRGTQRLRQFFLGSECLWTIVNLIVGTPFGLAANTLSLTSLLLGLWRNSQPAAGRMLNAAT
jgi:hypothetical protein